MSGDDLNDQDPDLSNEDFVVEDLGKSEDLDELFPAPGPAAAQRAVPNPAEPADEEDLLFTDHTQGLQSSEVFQGKGDFAATGPSDWDGEGLELDEVGVPPADADVAPGLAEDFGVVRDAFTEELGSMLHSEDEFGLDSEAELELVDGVDGSPGEFEVSGPFVLDDSEGEWQETVAADEEETTLTDGSDDEIPELEFEPTLSAATDEVEEGWEPLPESNMDELAEVGEVAPTDGNQAAGFAPHATIDPEGVEGHDIYAEDEDQATVLVGPRPTSSRVASILVTLAAMLLLFFAVGLVIARPEWFGLRVEPLGMEQVQIDRPSVRVVTTTPPVPAATASLLAGNTLPPDQKQPEIEGSTNPPVAVTPTVVPSVDVKPDPVVETPVPVEPSPPVAVTTNPVDPAVVDPAPVAPTAVSTVDQQAVRGVDQAWPVVVAPPAPTASTGNGETGLMRIGDDLMLGEHDPQPRSVHAIDGVMPGSRTFVQLHNGNYFVGNVKCLDEQSITLRMDQGEVTLHTADIEKLTELGSRDYDELQKATSGFVRLTNNNRLVGGILSRIADDHIVLEFRSNRVMLPRSAIGEIVQGENDAAVRLDTTREEDDWLRQIAERQLGTGQAAPAAAPTSDSKPVSLEVKPLPANEDAPVPTPAAPAPKPVTPVKKAAPAVKKPAAVTAPASDTAAKRVPRQAKAKH